MSRAKSWSFDIRWEHIRETDLIFNMEKDIDDTLKKYEKVSNKSRDWSRQVIWKDQIWVLII